jgi:cation transport protein ChaC
MWIFGYGSLMWDGWERSRGCRRRVVAELAGYARCFRKASVRNWGTRETPGPTLNLEASPTSCKGIAFEFDDNDSKFIQSYLIDREGKGFKLSELEIRLACGKTVPALVPIYSGKNLIREESLAKRAEMVRIARGTEGWCVDYVRGVVEKLSELGIEDLCVTEFWEAIARTRDECHVAGQRSM